MFAPARLELPVDEADKGFGARLALVPLPDDVSVSFHLAGDGGGTWTVSRRDGRTAVQEADALHPDCRVTCTVEDFRALLHGDLDARDAFLAGRLEVEGDVGLALRLQRVAR